MGACLGLGSRRSVQTILRSTILKRSVFGTHPEVNPVAIVAAAGDVREQFVEIVTGFGRKMLVDLVIQINTNAHSVIPLTVVTTIFILGKLILADQRSV